MTQPKPSTDAQTDDNQLQPAPLVTAGIMLAEGGVYGLVWLDSTLVTTAKYGRLVDSIAIAEPISNSIPALYGYDPDITALRGQNGKSFVLPAVSMQITKHSANDGPSPRLNLTVFWSQPDDGFILLVARTLSASQSDLEISQQMRKRLMAEEALAQKSRELEHANQDLEEYAAIISHDLSAPLRAIRYLTDDIETSLTSNNDKLAREQLTILRAQSRRMSAMMTALLDYASVGRKSEVRETVDTRAMLNDVIRSLPRPENMRINIKGNWPTVETLRAPLDLVIRNLIDNAIKHHDLEAGTITIEIQNPRAPDRIVFTVSDNGPGIAQKHHDAVLLPFRTLDTQPEASSHGIGLALVKRTVESIGGGLTLCSSPEIKRGTQFTVDWPLA